MKLWELLKLLISKSVLGLSFLDFIVFKSKVIYPPFNLLFSYCLRVIITQMKHQGQSNLGRNGFIWLAPTNHSSS